MWAAEGSKLDLPLSCFEKKMRNFSLQARFCNKEAGIVYRGVSWRFWRRQAAAVGPGSLPLNSPSAISDSDYIVFVLCAKSYTMIYKEVHVLKVCMSAYLDRNHVQHKR
jgi:hypothetical protein